MTPEAEAAYRRIERTCRRVIHIDVVMCGFCEECCFVHIANERGIEHKSDCDLAVLRRELEGRDHVL